MSDNIFKENQPEKDKRHQAPDNLFMENDSEATTFNAMETGAMRESIGTKIDTDLVPYELIVAAAVGLGLGSVKYDARNFEKGLSYKSLINSIERHCKALKDGEEIDADTGIPHYMLIASSTAMLVHNIMQEVIIDDRHSAKNARYSISELAQIGQSALNDALVKWTKKESGDHESPVVVTNKAQKHVVPKPERIKPKAPKTPSVTPGARYKADFTIPDEIKEIATGGGSVAKSLPEEDEFKFRTRSNEE